MDMVYAQEKVDTLGMKGYQLLKLCNGGPHTVHVLDNVKGFHNSGQI